MQRFESYFNLYCDYFFYREKIHFIFKKTLLLPISTLCRVNLAEVFQVLKVFKAPQELLDFRDRKETLVCLVFLDEKDRRDHRDLRASKVFHEMYFTVNAVKLRLIHPWSNCLKKKEKNRRIG